MHEIIPNLFVSRYNAVEVTPGTFIVNCTKNRRMLSSHGVRIAVNDDRSSECIDAMTMALPIAVEVIHAELLKGNRVVVHCEAGQQRSPTVVAAYLIAKCGYSLSDAIALVRAKKQDAFFWTVNFQDSLDEYAHALANNAYLAHSLT
jgi:hypothetical protein